MENAYKDGRPQLKRVRRPINRPQSTDSSITRNNASNFGENEKEPIISNQEEIRINEYLDNKEASSQKFQEEEYSPQKVLVREPEYISEETYQEEMYGLKGNDSGSAWMTGKFVILIAIVSLFSGLVIGKFVFSESKVVRNGLQGVVVNAEVPRGRARCGVAERAQGCVLYLMNPQRQDIRAKDFYDLAAQMTGRQRFMIETGNMRYANSKIKPGDIAQLNIPPL